MKTNTKTNIDIETILFLIEAFENFDKSFGLHNKSDSCGYFYEFISYKFEKNCFEYYISYQWPEAIDGEINTNEHSNIKNINLSLDQTNFDKLLLKAQEISDSYINEIKFKDWFMKLYEWKKKIDPIQQFVNKQTLSIISYIRDLKYKVEGMNNHLEYQNNELYSLSRKVEDKTQDIGFLELRLEYKEKTIQEQHQLILQYQKQIRDLQSPSLLKRIFKFQKLKI